MPVNTEEVMRKLWH